MKKPSKDLRKKFFTDYRDTTAFSSRARLLQSIWRDEKGFDFTGSPLKGLELAFSKP